MLSWWLADVGSNGQYESGYDSKGYLSYSLLMCSYNVACKADLLNSKT